jgi:hypothetical protein
VSTLMTERRRPLDNDDGQGSLFGGEAFAPARRTAPWERPTGMERATGAPESEASVATPPSTVTGHEATVAAPPTAVPAHDELVAGEEIVALERATVRSPQSPRAPLAGPTLDDVMSRVWEGLATGLPAACPVCQGDLVPSTHGRSHGSCSSCGTMIE